MTHFGISVALLTPFTGDGAVDHAAMTRHARALLDRGAGGITLFGTTGEGASIGMEERAAALDALMASGVPEGRIVLGIAASAVPDAAAQVAQGIARGVTTFLVPPPFYFKPVDDDGLFGWHATLLGAIPDAVQIIVYNIPQVTGVAVSGALAARLAAAFPGRIRAIKDSSGDWANAEALLAARALPVLVGDERLLHKAVSLGAAGSITGVANLLPERLNRILAGGGEDRALSDLVDAVVSVPVIPALKTILAQETGLSDWRRVRPPLVDLTETQAAGVLAAARAEAAHG